MPRNRVSAAASGLPEDPRMSRRRIYLTGRSPCALWKRLRFWIAYRRPVTFRDLRRIAYDAQYRQGLQHPDPSAEALFNAVIREAESVVWGR
ncbi:hypothetical protein [Chachezhania sediminis]|uniref:hypothetical protein n=1 Tax=Chachezhania sediminis TaxID=2599291 RepID=UPI001E38D2DA|nr:hypothetical protein [Chachezhania sediminis]